MAHYFACGIAGNLVALQVKNVDYNHGCDRVDAADILGNLTLISTGHDIIWTDEILTYQS